MQKTLVVAISLLLIYVTNGNRLNTLEGTSPNLSRQLDDVESDSNTSPYTYLQSFSSKRSIIDQEGTSAFLTKGGVVSNKNRASLFLCSLKKTSHCQSKYLADSIDLMVSINPMYAHHQKNMPTMYWRHKNFLGYMKAIGIPVVVIEAIYPNQGQKYMVTSAGNEPWEIQIHLETPIYYRENLVNVAARKLTQPWEYLLMIDGHQYFENLYWWEELIWKLERHSTVQFSMMGTYLNDVNQTFFYVGPSSAYCYSYRNFPGGGPFYNGNDWALGRETYEKIGHIIDICIAGDCDGTYFTAAMKHEDIELETSRNPLFRRSYDSQFMDWIWSASKAFKGQVTFVRGNLKHFNHEHTYNYGGAIGLCMASGYNAKKDLVRDKNFTLHMTNKKIADAFQMMIYGRITKDNIYNLTLEEEKKEENNQQNKNQSEPTGTGQEGQGSESNTGQNSGETKTETQQPTQNEGGTTDNGKDGQEGKTSEGKSPNEGNTGNQQNGEGNNANTGQNNQGSESNTEHNQNKGNTNNGQNSGETKTETQQPTDKQDGQEGKTSQGQSPNEGNAGNQHNGEGNTTEKTDNKGDNTVNEQNGKGDKEGSKYGVISWFLDMYQSYTSSTNPLFLNAGLWL